MQLKAGIYVLIYQYIILYSRAFQSKINYIFKLKSHTISLGSYSKLFASSNENNNENNGMNNQNDDKKLKSTKFDRVIDDFIGKRYGAGEAFYGRRVSDLDEKTYNKMTLANKPKTFDKVPLKDNAILIYGDLDAIGQFVAFELAEKGFNIRILCNDIKATTSLFGLPGNNVDIIELRDDSPLTDLQTIMQNVQAAIFCGNFIPTSNIAIRLNNKYIRYNDVCQKLIDIARAIKKTNSKSAIFQKIVYLSRYSSSSLAMSPLDALFSLNSPLYSTYRELTMKLEEDVRRSSFDYVIVRAPNQVESCRQGAKYDLSTTQSATDDVAPVIGVLDLAECVTQTLLLDVSGLTFRVSETRGGEEDENEPIIVSAAMEAAYGTTSKKDIRSERVPRRAYYSILNMDDVDMRSSYMIKPQEAYIEQLEEDRRVERYWSSKLSALKRDTIL